MKPRNMPNLKDGVLAWRDAYCLSVHASAMADLSIGISWHAAATGCGQVANRGR